MHVYHLTITLTNTHPFLELVALIGMLQKCWEMPVSFVVALDHQVSLRMFLGLIIGDFQSALGIGFFLGYQILSSEDHVPWCHRGWSMGMVQAWVAHFVTPITLPFHPQQHTNTTTMVVEPSTPPAAWIWWIYAARGAGGLVHVRSKVQVEGFW